MSVYHWESLTTEWLHSWMGQSSLLDFFMSAMSNKMLGVALFAALGIILFFRSDKKRAAHICALYVGALFIADFVSRHLVKEIVFRPRPRFVVDMCYKPHCFGFVSSHATDFFAVAAIFICLDRRNSFWALPLGLLVCVSRLFLYDHFPLDVIGGATLGLLIGSFIYWTDWSLFRRHRPNISRISDRINEIVANQPGGSD